MVFGIFAVRDVKAAVFHQPFIAPTRAAAVRGFSDAANDRNHEFAKHPEDYHLYEVGSYDDQTGLVSGVSPISLVAMASDLQQR